MATKKRPPQVRVPAHVLEALTQKPKKIMATQLQLPIDLIELLGRARASELHGWALQARLFLDRHPSQRFTATQLATRARVPRQRLRKAVEQCDCGVQVGKEGGRWWYSLAGQGAPRAEPVASGERTDPKTDRFAALLGPVIDGDGEVRATRAALAQIERDYPKKRPAEKYRLAQIQTVLNACTITIREP